MLMFYLLSGATHFLSIKIVSQKRRKSNLFRPYTAPKNSPHLEGSFCRNGSQIETHFDHRLGAFTLPGNRGLISAEGGNQSHHGTQFDLKSKEAGKHFWCLPALITAEQVTFRLDRFDYCLIKLNRSVEICAENATHQFICAFSGTYWGYIPFYL